MLVGLSGKKTPIMTDTGDRGVFIFVETSAMQITSEKGKKSKEEASKSLAGEEVSMGLGQWERPQSIARPGTFAAFMQGP